MTILLDFLDVREVALELLMAFAPLLLFFLYMQWRYLRLPRDYVMQLVKGVVLSYLGLVLFLQGVTQGFLPAGLEMGRVIGSAEWKWALVPLGFFFGLAVTAAEPSLRVLAIEMEKVSTGAITQRLVLVTLSLGVGVFVALGMFKLLAGIHILWFVVPGYCIALVMTRFSSPTFIAAAFDAGGASVGPMTVTFVMAIVLGVAGAMDGRDPVADGFGFVSLVSLAPILSVLILGIMSSRTRSDS